MRTKKSFKYQFQEVWQSIGMLYLVQIGMRLLALLIASKISGRICDDERNEYDVGDVYADHRNV
mgnify:CR=1 FL=1